MSQIKTKCGLCQQVKILQNSHLIPRSVYALASKAFSEQAGQLSIVSHKGMYNLAKQTTKYFLCDECESILDKRGENIVVKEFCKIKDDTVKFALLKKLNSLSGQFSSDKLTEWYFINDCELINVNAYIHFILGILWKMSATKWKDKPFDSYYNILGDYYENQIRQYLLTENPIFLDNIYIICLVDNKVNSYPWILFPIKKKCSLGYAYTFIVPGVKFLVFVGKKLSCEFFYSLPNDTHICFGKTNLDTDKDFINNIKLIRDSIPLS